MTSVNYTSDMVRQLKELSVKDTANEWWFDLGLRSHWEKKLSSLSDNFVGQIVHVKNSRKLAWNHIDKKLVDVRRGICFELEKALRIYLEENDIPADAFFVVAKPWFEKPASKRRFIDAYEKLSAEDARIAVANFERGIFSLPLDALEDLNAGSIVRIFDTSDNSYYGSDVVGRDLESGQRWMVTKQLRDIWKQRAGVGNKNYKVDIRIPYPEWCGARKFAEIAKLEIPEEIDPYSWVSDSEGESKIKVSITHYADNDETHPSGFIYLHTLAAEFLPKDIRYYLYDTEKGWIKDSYGRFGVLKDAKVFNNLIVSKTFKSSSLRIALALKPGCGGYACYDDAGYTDAQAFNDFQKATVLKYKTDGTPRSSEYNLTFDHAKSGALPVSIVKEMVEISPKLGSKFGYFVSFDKNSPIFATTERFLGSNLDDPKKNCLRQPLSFMMDNLQHVTNEEFVILDSYLKGDVSPSYLIEQLYGTLKLNKQLHRIDSFSEELQEVIYKIYPKPDVESTEGSTVEYEVKRFKQQCTQINKDVDEFISKTEVVYKPKKSEEKKESIMSKLNGVMDKMMSRMFRKVENVVYDMSTGSIGITKGGSIFSIAMETEIVGEGENEKEIASFSVTENLFEQMSMSLPAFAMARTVQQVTLGDLLVGNNGEVRGWVTDKSEKSISIIKPDGTKSRVCPPKVAMMGQTSGTVMVVTNMFGDMGGDNPMSNPMMMMAMMGDDDGEMDKDALVMMMLMQGTQGGQSGFNPMMLMAMMGDKKDGKGMDMKDMLMMQMMGGMGGQSQDQQGMMGGMNPMMLMMMMK